jgi:hypothetical protein
MPDAADLPVLVMSATTNVPPNAILPGVLGTLPKPFELEDLVRVLDEHC